MENNLKMFNPEIAPAPVKTPETQPMTNPVEDPDEDNPWVIPAPIINPPPKA